AARDLEVALEARDDEQLLEDLGRLGQREEPPRLEPRRDDEVARALRRGLAQDWRLDLEDARVFHGAPDRRDHSRTEAQVPLEAGAAQVDPAVPQAQRLVDAFVVELERQRRAAREDL